MLIKFQQLDGRGKLKAITGTVVFEISCLQDYAVSTALKLSDTDKFKTFFFLLSSFVLFFKEEKGFSGSDGVLRASIGHDGMHSVRLFLLLCFAQGLFKFSGRETLNYEVKKTGTLSNMSWVQKAT